MAKRPRGHRHRRRARQLEDPSFLSGVEVPTVAAKKAERHRLASYRELEERQKRKQKLAAVLERYAAAEGMLAMGVRVAGVAETSCACCQTTQ